MKLFAILCFIGVSKAGGPNMAPYVGAWKYEITSYSPASSKKAAAEKECGTGKFPISVTSSDKLVACYKAVRNTNETSSFAAKATFTQTTKSSFAQMYDSNLKPGKWIGALPSDKWPGDAENLTGIPKKITLNNEASIAAGLLTVVKYYAGTDYKEPGGKAGIIADMPEGNLQLGAYTTGTGLTLTVTGGTPKDLSKPGLMAVGIFLPDGGSANINGQFTPVVEWEITGGSSVAGKGKPGSGSPLVGLMGLGLVSVIVSWI